MEKLPVICWELFLLQRFDLSCKRKIERRDSVNIVGVKCNPYLLVADHEVWMMIHCVGEVPYHNRKNKPRLVAVKGVSFSDLSVLKTPIRQICESCLNLH
jgi:hypothetical protein